MQTDAATARPAALHGFSKTLVHVGFSGAGGVLQRHQEAARMRCVVAVIAAGPSIDVDDPVRSNNQMASMAYAVGKNRRTKACGQSQPRVIRRTCSGFRWRLDHRALSKCREGA